MERELKVVSWNVNGLDRGYLALRTKAQCSEILHQLPDIILLQEIVSETVEVFKSQLKSKYRIISSDTFFTQANREIPPFYQLIGWNKETIKRIGKPELERFSERGNHRHIISCSFKLKNSSNTGKNSNFYISTSHFESSRRASEERKQQFKFTLDRLSDIVCGEEHCSLGIFGGDTNLREKEASEILSSDNYVNINDCWSKVCPSTDKESKYTWDMAKNTHYSGASNFAIRTRYDRMLYNNCSKGCCNEWYPIFWNLIGITKISAIDLHPSDHFGIACTFLLFPDETETNEGDVIDLTCE